MGRIQVLAKRYENVAEVIKHRVQILLTDDPIGYRYSEAVRVLQRVANEDDIELWTDVLGAAKSLRWKLLHHPEADSQLIMECALKLEEQAKTIRPYVGATDILDKAVDAAIELVGFESALGNMLWEAVEDVTAECCVVVAPNQTASAAIRKWLAPLQARVFTAGELRREGPEADLALLVGPPRFFHSSMVTAPMTSEVSFLLPNWFGDQRIGTTLLAEVAENPIKVEALVKGPRHPSQLPHCPESGSGEMPDTEEEAGLMPAPAWPVPRAFEVGRQPECDETWARKVLLGGGYAVWIDDGDRIRALDPYQPEGEQVTYIDINSFKDLSPEQLARTEVYLLFRSAGSSQHLSLHEQAREALGADAGWVMQTQNAWKERLRSRLETWGETAVISGLRGEGVQAAGEARQWVGEDFTRPLRNDDFRHLLVWLGMDPDGVEYRNATMLRGAFLRASSHLQTQIEKSISACHLAGLIQDGHVTIEAPIHGQRGLTAARVLAVSPQDEVKKGHEVRVLQKDDSGRWLQ